MENAPLEPLNFHLPRRPADALWEALQEWCSASATLVQEQWNQILTQPVQVALLDVTPVSYKEVSAAMTPGAMGVHLKLGRDRIPSIVVLTALHSQALLAALLDLPGNDWPEPRELTAIESSMLEVLFDRLAFAIGESVPGTHSIPCRYMECMLRPERTRILSPTAEYYLVQIDVRFRFGNQVAVWVLPRKEIDDLLEETPGEDETGHRAERRVLESLSHRIPMEVLFELGSIELPMSKALALTLGDVIVLDQSIHRPLVASLEGVPKWIGMPVRVGPRQAFEIRESIGS